VAIVLVVSTGDGRYQARLSAAAGPPHTLEFVPGWAGVPALLERRPVDVVLLDAGSRDRLPYQQLAWLRRQHPQVARLVLLAADGREMDLFRLGRQGVDEMVLLGHEPLADTLPAALDRAVVRGVARRAAARLEGRVPELFTDALTWAVEQADAFPPPGPADLARAAARSPGAYRRELRRAGLPAPRRILLWGRLVRAAHLLHAPEPPPVEAVAHRLGYAAASSLARAFRRETGLPPSAVRERGGVAVVLDAMMAVEWRGSRSGRRTD
jgi:AraC-like DNA-binding protein